MRTTGRLAELSLMDRPDPGSSSAQRRAETSSGESSQRPKAVVVWDALGPIHIDRANALAQSFEVTVIELFSQSQDYDWNYRPRVNFEIRLVSDRRPSGISARIRFLLRFLTKTYQKQCNIYFLCHYERWYIFTLAVALRFLGKDVYVMQDSKFDDYSRIRWRELFKGFFYKPYLGALVGSQRSAEYLKFLGVSRISLGYNSGSVGRLREHVRDMPPPFFADRSFVVVARMIPKKNLQLAVQAFAEYRRLSGDLGRKMIFVGDGPEKARLTALINTMGLSADVCVEGWLAEPLTMGIIARSAALLLPSTEEQFGNVIGEAMSLGIPVIVSSNAGAADRLVSPLRNGFVLPPAGPAVWAEAMAYLVADEARWKIISDECRLTADETWEAQNFRKGVIELLSENSSR